MPLGMDLKLSLILGRDVVQGSRRSSDGRRSCSGDEETGTDPDHRLTHRTDMRREFLSLCGFSLFLEEGKTCKTARIYSSSRRMISGLQLF